MMSASIQRTEKMVVPHEALPKKYGMGGLSGDTGGRLGSAKTCHASRQPETRGNPRPAAGRGKIYDTPRSARAKFRNCAGRLRRLAGVVAARLRPLTILKTVPSLRGGAAVDAPLPTPLALAADGSVGWTAVLGRDTSVGRVADSGLSGHHGP
jgi:hypothetical protein